MTRRLTIALMTLVMSVSFFAVASVQIVTDLPDVVICNNKDAAGNDDTNGYTYTDAFDFNNYVAVQGVEKDSLLWGFEGTSLDAGSTSTLLLVNGVGDTASAYTEDVTGVNGAGTVDTTPTFTVASAPTVGGTETIEFKVDTGFVGDDDTATSSILVEYVDDAVNGKDYIKDGPQEIPAEKEDWADTTGWAAVDVYGAFGAYGDGTLSGSSQTPTVSGNALSVSLDNSEYMAFVNDDTVDVEAGKTYLAKIPVKVNYTASGTGAASYPVVRMLALYTDAGTKSPDCIMYLGATPAQNAYVDYVVAFTAESDSEDFKVRLDVANGTGSTLSVDFGQIQIYESGVFTGALTTEDWADTTGWAAVDVYTAFGAYGNGTLSGSSQTPTVSGGKLQVSLANSQYMSFINDNAVDVAGAGQYIVKIPVNVSYTASGTGAAAYPVVRFLASYADAGTKAPDCLMYLGYAAASNTTVDYYVAYTAESASEDFKVRLDMANGTGSTVTAEFGQIEAFSYVLP